MANDLIDPYYKYKPEEQYNPISDKQSEEYTRQRQAYINALFKRQPVNSVWQGVSNLLGDYMQGRALAQDKARDQRLFRNDQNRTLQYGTGPGGVPENPQVGAAETSSPDQAASESPSSASMGPAPIPAGSPPAADSPYLGFARTKLKTQLDNDPQLKHLLFSRAAAEDSPNPAAQIQETLNRYLARQDEFDKRGGLKAVINDAGFYPGTSLRGGNYSKKLPQYEAALEQALSGGNHIGYATDNASENVGFGYGKGANDPMTYRSSTGERYGIGNNKRDLAFAQRARSFDANMPGQAESIQRALMAPLAQGAPGAMTGDPGAIPAQAQAAANALARGPAKAPLGPSAYPVPGQPPTLPPNLLPTRPVVTREMMRDMLGNQYANPTIVGEMFQNYRDRNQPMVIEHDRGRLRYDPRRPWEQNWTSTDPAKTYKDAPMERVAGPNGPQWVIQVPEVREPGITAPTTGPGVPQQAAPSAGPDEDTGPPDITSDLSKPTTPPVPKQASPSMLGTPPPGMSPEGAPPALQEAPTGPLQLKAPPKEGVETQAAPTQAAPIGQMPLPSKLDKLQTLNNMEHTQERLKEESQEEGKLLPHNKQALMNAANAASRLEEVTQRMQAQVKSGNMSVGSFAKERAGLRNFGSTFFPSLVKEPTENYEFLKERAHSILEQLRAFVQTGGLGRVLQAEIGLFAESLADPNIPKSALLANLEQGVRMVKHIQKLGNMAIGMHDGYRLDAAGKDWVKDPNTKKPIKYSPGTLTNSDVASAALRYTQAHPIFTEAEKAGAAMGGGEQPEKEAKKKKADVVQPNKTIQGLFGNNAAPPTVTTEEQYNQLPSGAKYLDPNGVTRTKG